jgi:hypothetical protein
MLHSYDWISLFDRWSTAYHVLSNVVAGWSPITPCSPRQWDPFREFEEQAPSPQISDHSGLVQRLPDLSGEAGKYFASSLKTITLSGEVLTPRPATTSAFDYPEAVQAWFDGIVCRNSREKAFVTSSIFQDSLRSIVLPFIWTKQQQLRNLSFPALVISDRHKIHLSELKSALCASDGVTLLCYPHMAVTVLALQTRALQANGS